MKSLDRELIGHLPGQINGRCGAHVRHRLDKWGHKACCRNRPVPGRKRCRFHGGASTGAITAAGMERTVAAMKEGRQRWISRMKAEGQKIPCGRKSGDKWFTPKMLAKHQAERQSFQPKPPSLPKRKRGRPSRDDIIAEFLQITVHNTQKQQHQH